MANIIEAFVAFDTSKLRNAVAIAEAGRAGEVRFLGETDVLLRGRADRIWALPADQETWARVHGGGTLAHSEKARRAGED